jgi:hypothetical protein
MTITEQTSVHTSEFIELLTESNRLYTLMLDTLEKLSQSPEAGSDAQLHARNQNFNKLQNLLEKHDKRLATIRNEVDFSMEVVNDLLAIRLDLLQKVRSKNKTVTIQVEAVKSLLANEIQKFKTGHTALQGYRRGEQSGRTNYFKGTF